MDFIEPIAQLMRRGSVGQEYVVHRRQFAGVAQRGAGAVRFDQTDRRRTNPRARIGPLQGQYLPFQARRGHAAALAVARSGYAFDHRIDAIAIPLGVFHALQHHHADAFADGYAVGRLIERAAAAPARQRLRLGEAQVAEGALRRVDAAHDGHVARMIRQLARGQVHGRQRRGAGRVHAEVHAAQVEAVGHPPGGYVEQQPGEGIFGPLGQLLAAAPRADWR